MHNMFVTDSDDEEEDDWFYDTITRYQQLRMFDCENIVKHLEFSDKKSICTAGKHKSGRHEVLELTLPEKMTAPPDQEGFVKNSDMKLKSGGYTNSLVDQMKVFYGKSKIAVSETGQCGVSVYQLGSSDSDLIKRINHIPSKLLTPYLALKETDLLLATTTKQCMTLVDMNTGDTVRSMSLSRSMVAPVGEHDVKTIFATPDVVAVCDTENGDIYCHDIRSDKPCSTISHRSGNHISGNSVKPELWTIASSYNASLNAVDANLQTGFHIGMLSSTGEFLSYDMRDPSVALCRADINSTLDNNTFSNPDTHLLDVTLQFCPNNSSKISISGFDGNVYIYDMSSPHGVQTIFVHEGHGKLSRKEPVRTARHIWYSDSVVISAAEDTWLHCWQFVPNVGNTDAQQP